MTTDPWNPDQYEKFKAQRAQPFHDLVALVDCSRVRTALDLGCGTGELTATLHRKLAAGRTLGVDTSPAMLARAAAFAGDGLAFEQADIASYASGQTFDLVLSNAALHWVPDHEVLLPRLLGWVAPGGQVAAVDCASRIAMFCGG